MTAPATNEERTAALEAVRAASEVTTQRRLVEGDTLIKGDESPVTVADFAAQALVAATLADALGEIDMVGEEDATDPSALRGSHLESRRGTRSAHKANRERCLSRGSRRRGGALREFIDLARAEVRRSSRGR